MLTYLTDFAPGWDVFEREKGSEISDIIVDIEKAGSSDIKSFFYPSHVFKVVNATTGIEAAEGGVAYFPLSKYLDNPKCELVFCRPQGLTDQAVSQMLTLGDKLVKAKVGYGYLDLARDALIAFTGLEDVIPALHHLGTQKNHLFCSALVSLMDKSADIYKDVWLFNEYSISEISPLMLMSDMVYDIMNPFRVKEG